MAALNGDTTQIVSVADYAEAVKGEYEGYLGAWANTKDEMAVFVKSNGLGNAIQETMGNAHMKGKAIVQKMDEILQVLKESGHKFGNINLEAAQQVRATSLGSNSTIDTGSWT